MISKISLIGIVVPGLPGNKQIETLCKRYGGQIIDFYTTRMDELSVIAKYRVLPVPTLLVIYNSKMIGRIVKNIPPTEKLDSIIKDISREIV